MVISKNWDDTRTFDQICENSIFSYFFTRGGKLAPGDYQYPHIVSEKKETGLVFTSIECVGGLTVRGDGIAGHGFISEADKTFDIQMFRDAKECVKEYLILSNQHEYLTGELPNNIDLQKLSTLLEYSDRYDISIQFWTKQTAVYIMKGDVDLCDFGGDFDFAIDKSIQYLDEINRRSRP